MIINMENKNQIDSIINLQNPTEIYTYGIELQENISNIVEIFSDILKSSLIMDISEQFKNLVNSLKIFDIPYNDNSIKKALLKADLLNQIVLAEKAVTSCNKKINIFLIEIKKQNYLLDYLNIILLNCNEQITKMILSLNDQKDKICIENNSFVISKAYSSVQLYNIILKRLEDLELSKQLALQTSKQIQNNIQSDTILIDKMQSLSTTTLPFWNSQLLVLKNNPKEDKYVSVCNTNNSIISMFAEIINF